MNLTTEEMKRFCSAKMLSLWLWTLINYGIMFGYNVIVDVAYPLTSVLIAIMVELFIVARADVVGMRSVIGQRNIEHSKLPMGRRS